MHLGAVTYNVLKNWDLETILKNLEAAGFEAVELRTGHKHGVEPSISKEERERVRKLFDGRKVRLLSYGTECEFHSPDAAVRARNVATGKQFVELAHDTGAWGVKVRPNGLPIDIYRMTTVNEDDVRRVQETVQNIASSLRELGDYGQKYGVEIWLEVHGRETAFPQACAEIMKATNHKQVGLCWNSNPTDVVNGSVKQSWQLLRPWVKSAHITELADPRYPWRELFTLMRDSGYDRYTLCEAAESKEPERFLRWYKALWIELNRPCAG